MEAKMYEFLDRSAKALSLKIEELPEAYRAWASALLDATDSFLNGDEFTNEQENAIEAMPRLWTRPPVIIDPIAAIFAQHRTVLYAMKSARHTQFILRYEEKRAKEESDKMRSLLEKKSWI